VPAFRYLIPHRFSVFPALPGNEVAHLLSEQVIGETGRRILSLGCQCESRNIMTPGRHSSY